MSTSDKMPVWVALAYSNIGSRKVALWLVLGCALFTVYCFPWTHYFGGHGWVKQLFLVDDWSWFAVMIPTTAWYWLALNWIDRHAGWLNSRQD